ncbi:hypothetical protein N752_29185 [Desulforamulus aquiferis]|nr:hypothetical protein [Desulforamulus aquiferis]RYD01654.1 hypothetical protein N752_29185 [Desulforamulus aquiferis]
MSETILPAFLGEENEQAILQRMLSRVPEDIDKNEAHISTTL